MQHKSEKEGLALKIEKEDKIKELMSEKLESQQREFLSNAVTIEMQSKL